MLVYVAILAFISALNFAAALVAHVIRRAPASRFGRAETFISLAAAAYSALQIGLVSGAHALLGGAHLFAIAIFVAAYAIEIFRLVAVANTGWVRGFAAATIGLAGLAAIPGMAYRGEWVEVPMGVGGLSEPIAPLSPLGLVAVLSMLALGFTAFFRGFGKLGQLASESRAYLLGGMLIAFTGVWDALLISGVVRGPKLTPFAMAFPALAVLYVMARRTVDDARGLDELRRSLEGRVERRAAELADARSVVLETERLAAIGRIASGLAHEINNPLGAALANTEHVRRRLDLGPVGDPQPLIAALADAQSSLERSGQVVHQLLDSAVLELVEPGHPVSVERLCEEVMHQVRGLHPGLPKLAITLERELWVAGGSERLVRVLVPLVDNAIRAARDAGRDPVEAVALAAREVEEGVEIVIRDEGPGMSADLLARIREPFFTTRTPGDGRGLGLSVADGLLRAMGSELELESEEGAGTRARFVLARAEAPRAEVVPEASARVPRLRLLVVDDDPMVLRGLCRMLSAYANITRAAGVEEALAAVARAESAGAPFNAILSDLVMPEGGGPRFFAELSTSMRDRVVFLTGGAADAGVREFLESQPRPVLYKPAKRDEILAALLEVAEAALEGSSSRSA